MRRSRSTLAPLLALLAGLPAGAEEMEPGSVQGEMVEPVAHTSVHDPWEPMNRGIFAFNEGFDRWLLEPVAIGWDFVLPDPVQTGLENFFENLVTPRRMVNDLLQAKPRKAGSDFGRLLVNTTFGLAGFFDVATRAGLPPADEDFGQTLGVWGVPPGPYLVLPFFGPSSPRDATGLAVDRVVLAPQWYFVPWYVSYPATGTQIVNLRSLHIEEIRAERASAFDFYAAVRNAWVSYRANQVRDRADAPEEEEDDEDLYYFDEEDE